MNAAGCLIEPPVSVAVATGHNDAATAADEPPEDPPGTNSFSEFFDLHGFTTDPLALVSLDEPMANSSLLSLPSIIIPDLNKFSVTVDS